MPARVMLYTRVGCHLCEDARDVVAAACAALEQDWEEVDIDADPELRARYGDEIPVATVDGETVGFWRIDPERLRGALS
ncbi:glutaredoxin family protein [Demequina sp. SYSU T00192]|uniref:Glutaredoxin family protein n=1 Tax=Demequina litoralis TaxID=3051660 RepID=A0ABT8G863_9MICO|nr:glutaredoxin family protein [Demequina sp. SYSU T00192]MDN4475337.1 glutaredoxin family protein [Demequina sp. SYSU T00192]